MSKQQVRYSRSEPGQIRWQAVGSIASLAGLFLLLLGVAWLYTSRAVVSKPLFLTGAMIIIALHGLLVVAGERLLAYTRISPPWRYRLALLISASIALAYWFLLILVTNHRIPWIWIVVAFAGTLAGGLMITWLREPLWEDNSPTSALIQAEVQKHHFEYLGVPDGSSASKRIFDFGLALVGLILSAPIWLLIVFLVWFEEPGPVLFVKNSVGLGGVNFHQFKFRTMVRGAEKSTGPVLASEVDGRVLLIGRLLRKTALDELPQLLNILRGEMSFVGPRPQRTVLVYGYLQDIHEYAERHRVLPGLSGLAQVAGDYYLTPMQKLRFDRLYICHSSLGFDLKLLSLAFLITFWYRWQNGWDGRLPRRLLHSNRRVKDRWT